MPAQSLPLTSSHKLRILGPNAKQTTILNFMLINHWHHCNLRILNVHYLVFFFFLILHLDTVLNLHRIFIDLELCENNLCSAANPLYCTPNYTELKLYGREFGPPLFRHGDILLTLCGQKFVDT